MRVRLKQLVAGPDGVFDAGTELERADGAALVAAGYAESLEPPVVERAVEPPAETTAMQSAPQQRKPRGRQ